jgi:hypothetical protein
MSSSGNKETEETQKSRARLKMVGYTEEEWWEISVDTGIM